MLHTSLPTQTVYYSIPALSLLATESAQASGRGIGSSNFQDMPEWKKNILGGPKVSYGKKEKRSILEQRQVR